MVILKDAMRPWLARRLSGDAHDEASYESGRGRVRRHRGERYLHVEPRFDKQPYWREKPRLQLDCPATWQGSMPFPLPPWRRGIVLHRGGGGRTPLRREALSDPPARRYRLPTWRPGGGSSDHQHRHNDD